MKSFVAFHSTLFQRKIAVKCIFQSMPEEFEVILKNNKLTVTFFPSKQVMPRIETSPCKEKHYFCRL